jgi:hypothetical protein
VHLEHVANHADRGRWRSIVEREQLRFVEREQLGLVERR